MLFVPYSHHWHHYHSHHIVIIIIVIITIINFVDIISITSVVTIIINIIIMFLLFFKTSSMSGTNTGLAESLNWPFQKTAVNSSIELLACSQEPQNQGMSGLTQYYKYWLSYQRDSRGIAGFKNLLIIKQATSRQSSQLDKFPWSKKINS